MTKLKQKITYIVLLLFVALVSPLQAAQAQICDDPAKHSDDLAQNLDDPAKHSDGLAQDLDGPENVPTLPQSPSTPTNDLERVVSGLQIETSQAQYNRRYQGKAFAGAILGGAGGAMVGSIVGTALVGSATVVVVSIVAGVIVGGFTGCVVSTCLCES